MTARHAAVQVTSLIQDHTGEDKMGKIKYNIGQWTDGELLKRYGALRTEIANLKKGTPAWDSCMDEMKEISDEMADRQEYRGQQRRYLRGIWHSAQGPEAGSLWVKGLRGWCGRVISAAMMLCVSRI